MRIPLDAVIPEEKFTRYLLVQREFDDKSKFLNTAGFTLENYHLLIHELRRLIREADAFEEHDGPYGMIYRVTGELTGPRGERLPVVTIWMRGKVDGRFRFITLKPCKEKSK